MGEQLILKKNYWCSSIDNFVFVTSNGEMAKPFNMFVELKKKVISTTIKTHFLFFLFFFLKEGF